MNRRDFIKTSLCIASVACLSGCTPFMSEDAKKYQKFIYKSDEELPKRVKLDACTLCQLSCVKCWRTLIEDTKIEPLLGYLKFNDFKKFVDKNKDIEEIDLTRLGELFLNPELDKIIKYAYKKNITLTAGSGVNLNTLSDEMAENLVKYQFKNLIISIDGTSPETYKIYRRGGDFNKVIENIKKINKYKDLYFSKYPELTYKFIVFGHNEHEIEQVKPLAEKLNMKYRFEKNYTEDYSPVKDVERVKKLTGIDYSKKRTLSCVEEYFQKESGWIFCLDLFKTPNINWDGTLYSCCLHFCLSNKDLPNVFKNGYKNELNNENYLYEKLMLTDFNTPPRMDIFCSHCDIYKEMAKMNKRLNTEDIFST